MTRIMFYGLLTVLTLAGCSGTKHLPGKQCEILLRLFTPPEQDAFEGVSALRVSLAMRDGETLVANVDVAEEEIVLTGSPTEGAVLLLEGLGVDGKQVVSSGGSAPFSLSPDTITEVGILFARRGEFARLEGELGVCRFGHRAAALPDGRVLLFGGATSGDVETPQKFAPPEIYDPISQKSCLFEETLCPDFPGADRRMGHTATAAPESKVLVFGGVDEQGEFVEETLLYDFDTGSFRELTNYDPDQVRPRTAHAAEWFRSDDASGGGYRDVILLAGGEASGLGGQVLTSNGLIFDVFAETFTQTNLSMVQARRDFSLTSFGPEKNLVLAVGGQGSSGLVSAGEIFDGSVFKTVEPVGEQARNGLLSPRIQHSALWIEAGILIVGGYDGLQSIDAPELFMAGDDSGTGFFSLDITDTPADHSTRRGAVAWQSPDGSVIISGGEAYDGFEGTLLSSSESIRLDSQTLQASFSAGQPLGRRLAFPSVSGLVTGGVLIAGGLTEGQDGPQPSAEVWYYNP